MKAVILLFAIIAILVAVNIPAIYGEAWADPRAKPVVSMDDINKWAQEALSKLNEVMKQKK
nr:U21_MYRTX_Ta1b [Tetramorium africanum]